MPKKASLWIDKEKSQECCREVGSQEEHTTDSMKCSTPNLEKLVRNWSKIRDAGFIGFFWIWEIGLCVPSQLSARQINSWGLWRRHFSSLNLYSHHPTCCSVLRHVICHNPPIIPLNASQQWGPCPLSAMGSLVSAIKLKFRFWLITGKEYDKEGNAYSLTHDNGCKNQPATSLWVCESQKHGVTLISECLQVYFTALLKAGSYLIRSSSKGIEKGNFVLSASLISPYFMK